MVSPLIIVPGSFVRVPPRETTSPVMVAVDLKVMSAPIPYNIFFDFSFNKNVTAEGDHIFLDLILGNNYIVFE